jgi:hypothetical protein
MGFGIGIDEVLLLWLICYELEKSKKLGEPNGT